MAKTIRISLFCLLFLVLTSNSFAQSAYCKENVYKLNRKRNDSYIFIKKDTLLLEVFFHDAVNVLLVVDTFVKQSETAYRNLNKQCRLWKSDSIIAIEVLEDGKLNGLYNYSKKRNPMLFSPVSQKDYDEFIRHKKSTALSYLFDERYKILKMAAFTYQEEEYANKVFYLSFDELQKNSINYSYEEVLVRIEEIKEQLKKN